MWRWADTPALVIRTDFSHDDEWTRLQPAIVEPQSVNRFEASVTFVDEPANDGLTVPQLLELVPADAEVGFAFLADTETLTHPDRPILVVNLRDWDDDFSDRRAGRWYGTTFRVVPSHMWSIQNNLSISNMDWWEYAENVDADGVFRGFPDP